MGERMYIYTVLYVLVIPFCVLIHEIGHAFANVLTSDNQSHVHLAGLKDSSNRSFEIGRISCHLKWSYYGFCIWGGKLSKNQRIGALIGETYMSLIMAVVFVFSVNTVSNESMQALLSSSAGFCASLFLATAIPVKYP